MSVSGQLSSESQFQANLAFGRMAESLIARWLIARGNHVLPVYDIEYATGKGPRLFGRSFQAAAPDLCVWTTAGTMWCEAKHKSVFSWHRKTQRWVTGIDLNHWVDYLRIAEATGSTVWLLFLHERSEPWHKDLAISGCPPECPTGLFGETIATLKGRISHTHMNHGRHGMIYFTHQALRQLATLAEIQTIGR